MSAPPFTDKNRRPNEQSIEAALGRAARAWHVLFDQLHAEHPDLTEAWNYYADGKRWLLKVSRGAKTVCWVAVEPGAFRIACYFPERLAGALLDSDLSEALKTQIRSTAPSGKLRSVSVTFGPQRGVRDVLTLVGLKKTLK